MYPNKGVGYEPLGTFLDTRLLSVKGQPATEDTLPGHCTRRLQNVLTQDFRYILRGVHARLVKYGYACT